MLPSIIIFALFTYYPMYGIVIAFKKLYTCGWNYGKQLGWTEILQTVL